MNQRAVVVVLALASSACGPGLAARYEAGNQALSSGDGAMYFIVISPRLQQALNECIPAGLAGASKVLVLVADVDAAGNALNLDVQPGSAGTQCVREQLTARPLPKPPLESGATSFPIGLRIDTR